MNCLHCRLWETVAAEADDGRIDAVGLLRARSPERGRVMRALAVLGLLTASFPAFAAGTWVDRGFWRMNETTGNVVSDQIARLNGTAFNAPIVLNACNAGSSCRSFNGSTSHILVPYGAAIDPGFMDLSYSAWIKPSLPKPSNGDDIIHVSGYPAPHFKLEISEADSQGKAKCGVRGAALKTVAAFGGPDLYDGKWHKLECRVVRKPVDHLELWVDDVLVKSINGSIGYLAPGTPMYLGKHHAVEAGRYSGRMDDIRIRWRTP